LLLLGVTGNGGFFRPPEPAVAEAEATSSDSSVRGGAFRIGEITSGAKQAEIASKALNIE
jgi:hypothetical protein